jgi:hypothetical protein
VVLQYLHFLFEILETVIKLPKPVVSVNTRTVNLGKCFELNFGHLSLNLTQYLKPILQVIDLGVQVDLGCILEQQFKPVKVTIPQPHAALGLALQVAFKVHFGLNLRGFGSRFTFEECVYERRDCKRDLWKV